MSSTTTTITSLAAAGGGTTDPPRAPSPSALLPPTDCDPASLSGGASSPRRRCSGPASLTTPVPSNSTASSVSTRSSIQFAPSPAKRGSPAVPALGPAGSLEGLVSNELPEPAAAASVLLSSAFDVVRHPRRFSSSFLSARKLSVSGQQPASPKVPRTDRGRVGSVSVVVAPSVPDSEDRKQARRNRFKSDADALCAGRQTQGSTGRESREGSEAQGSAREVNPSGYWGSLKKNLGLSEREARPAVEEEIEPEIKVVKQSLTLLAMATSLEVGDVVESYRNPKLHRTLMVDSSGHFGDGLVAFFVSLDSGRFFMRNKSGKVLRIGIEGAPTASVKREKLAYLACVMSQEDIDDISHFVVFEATNLRNPMTVILESRREATTFVRLITLVQVFSALD